MKLIYFAISIVLLSTFAVAAPISLEINANYYSHTLEFTGTFASTNVGMINDIPKSILMSQISLPSTTSILSSLRMTVRNMPELPLTNESFFPARNFEFSSYTFFTSSEQNIGFMLRTPLISSFMNYNYASTQLEAFSAGFTVGPISTLGWTNPGKSELLISFPNGMYVSGGINDSTGTVKVGLPFSIGNFFFQPEGQYTFPSKLTSKISLSYMNDGIIPYIVYDGESTPIIAVGIMTLPFSAYAKMTMSSSPIYTIGSIYRSAMGVVGLDFNVQNSNNWTTLSLSSVPFGFGNLRFGIDGDGQISNNGNYTFKVCLTTSLNVFSSILEGWVGIMSDNIGNYKTLWGMDVNF